MMPYTNNVKVPEAGGSSTRTDAREQISRTPGDVVLTRFRFAPLLGNTDLVVVGDGGVRASTDTDEDESQGIVILPLTSGTDWFDVPEGADMADWWVDARVADEGVGVFGFRK